MQDHELEKSSDAKAVPRRIALIRAETPARLLRNGEETVMSAPHLLLREVVLFQIVIIALAAISLLFDAPLETIADPAHTPNPAKAPWYFLGLQELLHYFPPIVAGVLLPALVVVSVVVIPYFRVNLEMVGFYERPWKRTLAGMGVVVLAGSVLLAAREVWAMLVPTWIIFALMSLPAFSFTPERLRRRLSRVALADWIMTWFVTLAVTLTLIGVLFRGPGWSWVWPGQGGAH